MMTSLSRTIAAFLFALMAALSPAGAESAAAALHLSAREVDLGDLGPGETAQAQFRIENTAEGRIRWTLAAPPEWEGGGVLSGEAGSAPSKVDVTLVSLREGAGAGDHPVEIRLASGRGVLVLRRMLAEGPWREALRIESDSGGRTLFVKFVLTDARSRPALEAEPRGIDLGDTEPVREITRKIRVSNTGAGVLRWQVSSGATGMPSAPAKGRYLSLHNDALQAGGPYATPAALMEAVQAMGPWGAEKGYPKAAGHG
mgnify:CR=1 FL=1